VTHHLYPVNEALELFDVPTDVVEEGEILDKDKD